MWFHTNSQLYLGQHSFAILRVCVTRENNFSSFHQSDILFKVVSCQHHLVHTQCCVQVCRSKQYMNKITWTGIKCPTWMISHPVLKSTWYVHINYCKFHGMTYTPLEILELFQISWPVRYQISSLHSLTFSTGIWKQFYPHNTGSYSSARCKCWLEYFHIGLVTGGAMTKKQHPTLPIRKNVLLQDFFKISSIYSHQSTNCFFAIQKSCKCNLWQKYKLWKWKMYSNNEILEVDVPQIIM